MTTETVYSVLMWMYPLSMVGICALILVSAKKRPLYAILFVGTLLSFIGLVRYRVFHDPHSAFLLSIAAYPLLLVSGFWGLAHAFSQRKRSHT